MCIRDSGAADVGIVGKDILTEAAADVYELLDTGLGRCRTVSYTHLAGRCPNNSSLFPPLAAVVIVAAHSQRKEYL